MVSEAAWDYLAAGSGDNHTLRRNIEAWASLRLSPRMLVDVSTLDTRLSLLGHDLDAPVLIAPTASHGLFHPGAEVETARGAAAARTLLVASTNSTLPVEDIGAAASGPWWFQLYVVREPSFTRDLVAPRGARRGVGTRAHRRPPAAGPGHRLPPRPAQRARRRGLWQSGRPRPTRAPA